MEIGFPYLASSVHFNVSTNFNHITYIFIKQCNTFHSVKQQFILCCKTSCLSAFARYSNDIVPLSDTNTFLCIEATFGIFFFNGTVRGGWNAVGDYGTRGKRSELVIC